MTEKKVVLRNCGLIDPGDIETHIARDGFKALTRAMAMTPQQVIDQIKQSGLRGRGGAGFPCGLKWELTRNAAGDEKYIICNADEGEVGTFKDRYILENDPFTLIEGMAIAGHAIGAGQGYIYLRAEYRFLLETLLGAIEQAKNRGFLNHIDIEIREGAGAYVCGEESALMDSIEGGRGEARYKPPFPPDRGLWQKPTVINNVETLMNVSYIILEGAAQYSQMGTERSKGTKVFSVSGDVASPGVYELELGSSLKELVVDLAGAENVQMVQIGGATGRLLPAEMLDTPLSFESYLGAGAITVFDESRDIVDIVHRTMEFLAEESCGKCSPCREGTDVMVAILGRFVSDEGSQNDIRVLRELSDAMMLASLCGLGQAAPNPVVDSLQYFRTAYERRMPENMRGVTP